MGKGIVEIFKGMPDPRVGNAKKHKLEEILTIAILAVLCDYTQFTEMEMFGEEQEEWLKGFLTLEHGIPSHDTCGEVFAAIDPNEFRDRFMELVSEIRERVSNEIVVISGKRTCTR